MQTPEALVISEERAAQMLELSPRTLQRWRVEGRGPTFRKLGKRVVYVIKDLQEFVDAGRRTSTSGAAA